MHCLKKVCIRSNFKHKYTLQRLLGEGSFSKVYLGIKNKTGSKFAIKSINKHKLFNEPTALKCFINEIKVLRLLDHPNIVKLYEVYETRRHVNLVMEYVEGENLYTHLEKRAHYSEKDTSTLLKQMLEALNYCHTHSIIHRDIKSENIMIE